MPLVNIRQQIFFSFALLDEILKVNDSVLKIMIEYKKIVEGISEENGIGTLTSSSSKGALQYKFSFKILSKARLSSV